MFNLSLFIFLVSHQISTIGALVYSSISSTNFYGPALMAFIQASANSVALIFAHYFINKLTFRRVFLGILVGVMLNTGVSFYLNAINPFTLFFRIFIGALGLGIILSYTPRLISLDYKIGNQKLQYWLCLTSLIGFAIAPLLADSVNKLFIFDLFLTTIFCIIVFSFNIDESFSRLIENTNQTSNIQTPFFILPSEKNYFLSHFLLFFYGYLVAFFML